MKDFDVKTDNNSFTIGPIKRLNQYMIFIMAISKHAKLNGILF